MRTKPRARSKPATQRSNVVFPHPDGPKSTVMPFLRNPDVGLQREARGSHEMQACFAEIFLCHDALLFAAPALIEKIQTHQHNETEDQHAASEHMCLCIFHGFNVRVDFC